MPAIKRVWRKGEGGEGSFGGGGLDTITIYGSGGAQANGSSQVELLTPTWVTVKPLKATDDSLLERTRGTVTMPPKTR